MKIPFFVQEFTNEMEEAVIDALRNELFVNGESVSKFEEEFARYIGTKYAVSVNSGNSALQLSLMALDMDGNIQKVATPTNSFIASANCIRMTNAQPILTDIDARDGGIDVNSITEKVDAVIPVHIYGNPCDFDSVKTFAEEKKIPIVEDACQAHGATSTNNEEIADKIRSIRDNGRKTKNEFDKLGFTMRLNTVNAAIGRIQLKHLDEKNSRRREIVSIYKENLIEDCILPENENGKSVYHQIVIRHENRDKIHDELTNNDIGSAIYYEKPIHLQPFYLEYDYKLPNSEKFANEVLSLPSYPSLTNDQLLEVCEHVNKIIG